MSLMGYKARDIERMQEALEYAMQDANDNGDNKQAKELLKVFELLEGLLVEGRV